MIVKCWNCKNEFEHVSSAADSNKQHNLTAAHIEELLLANMFDATRGTIIVNVNDLIDEIAEVLEKNWKK